MNVIIQPVHLILYTVFVSSAIELATKNLLYALVAIAFLIPAEKFIKSMFGLDKAKSTSSFGSFAGGALAMQGLQKLASGGSKGNSSKGGTGSGNNGEEDRDKVAFANNPNSKYGDLSTVLNDANGDDSVDSETRSSRNMWQGMVDDPNETEQNKLDAQREIERIDSMRTEAPKSQNQEQKPKSNWQTIKGWAGKKARKYSGQKGQLARKAAVGGARLAGKAVGVVGGTMIGIGAGLTTGDASKVFQYGAAGAVAGNAIGNKAGNLVDGTLNTAGRAKNYATNLHDELYEEKYGTEKLLEIQAERQNKQAEKAFMQNKQNIERAQKLKTKMQYNGDTEDIMEQMIDLEKAGITDKDMANNIIKGSYEKDKKLGGSTYETYKDVGVYATKEGFDKSYITDQKKRENMDNVLESKVGKSNGFKVGSTLAEIHGEKSLYAKKSKLAPRK